jgi:lipopolysaccharide/colanic/teichoic acid biosynthesis glycosyltransferase
VVRIRQWEQGVEIVEPVPVVKRVFDLVAAGVGLVVLGPVMVGIGAAIRAETPGGALFRQERVGRGGRVFRLIKFRTMAAGVPVEFNADGSTKVTRGDARVTRVGRRLRGALDELPQLINVLKGEMSLVGPRPDMPVHAEMYTEEEKGKLRVKPGMTSLAAVLGRNQISWRSRIAIDLRYVENWSFGLDLKIIAQTLALPFGVRLFSFEDLVRGVEIRPAGGA